MKNLNLHIELGHILVSSDPSFLLDFSILSLPLISKIIITINSFISFRNLFS